MATEAPKRRCHNVALGPDCDDSPHPIRELPLDLGTAPYIAVLFGPQKADPGHRNKTVKHEGSQAPDVVQTQNNELPSPEEVLVTNTDCAAGGLRFHLQGQTMAG